MACVERIKQLEQENKNLKEKLSEITMVADDEKQSIEHILELEEENKKLKEKLSKREQWKYRYFWNDGEQDIYEITSIKD